MSKRKGFASSPDVKELVDKILGDMHEKRKQSVLDCTMGVIASNSLICHRIGVGLAAEEDLFAKHAIKQIDRLMGNDKFDPYSNSDRSAAYIIGSRKEIVTAMDWTDHDHDDQATIQISLVTSHGRATPLIWKTVRKKNLKDKRNDYEDELLCRLRKIVASDVHVTVLADRGFGDTKLYNFLKDDLGFDYIIRFRGNIQVTSEDGEIRNAVDWVGLNGRAQKLYNAGVTALECKVPAVVCVKAKGMKQAWCIAASNSKLPANKIIKWYAKRWGIEPQFRDTKDLHFGMGLSQTHIKEPTKRDRILLVWVLAVIILTLLGAVGERLGLDRQLKVNTSKKRSMSLLRQGCYYYLKLRNMSSEKRVEFLNCFVALLREHITLQEALWVI